MNRRRTAEELGLVQDALKQVNDALAEWETGRCIDPVAMGEVVAATAGAVAKIGGTVARILADQVVDL
jgi:hypothetical protein